MNTAIEIHRAENYPSAPVICETQKKEQFQAETYVSLLIAFPVTLAFNHYLRINSQCLVLALSHYTEPSIISLQEKQRFLSS
jgi:hypothetical protein